MDVSGYLGSPATSTAYRPPATPRPGLPSWVTDAGKDLPAFRVVPPSPRFNLEDLKLPDGTSMIGYDGLLIPPARSFSMVVNAATRIFSYRFDEAMRDNFVNARAMRRDAFLEGLFEERILPTINRKYQLDIDDDTHPDQKMVRDAMAKIIAATRGLDMFKRALMDGAWFGRAGCQWNSWRNPEVNDLWTINKWDPVHGDSIQYTFDGVPAILMDSMTAGWYTQHGATKGPLGDIRTTDRGGFALVLQRPYWRDRFAINQHMRRKADFFEGELAGSVQGFGLRGQVYWHYVIRTEALTWMLAYMQAVGQMDLLVFNYPQGDDAAKLNAEAMARQIIGKAAIACPRNPQGTWPAVEQIPMNSEGLKALHDLISDYFDRHIERLIVGQSMSSGADNDSGLGGTGRAEFAKATKDEILNYDTNRLDDTLTTDFVRPLKEANFPWAKFPVRYKSILPDSKARDKVQSGETMIKNGVKIKVVEFREAAGYSRPEEGDETVGGPETAGAGGPPGSSPQSPMHVQGGPFGTPGQPQQPAGPPGQPPNPASVPPQTYPRQGGQPAQPATPGQPTQNRAWYSKDASGHEHKGKGEGGGQFTSGSGSGESETHADAKPISPHDTPPEKEYGPAGKRVDGRKVLSEVPNQDSIDSSIDNPEVLPGIREVPLSAFDPRYKPNWYSATERARTERLAEKIKENNKISPLIVVIDSRGPYILEGGHRFDALHLIGAKSFPAMVVIDTDSAGDDPAEWKWKYTPKPGDEPSGNPPTQASRYARELELVTAGAWEPARTPARYEGEPGKLPNPATVPSITPPPTPGQQANELFTAYVMAAMLTAQANGDTATVEAIRQWLAEDPEGLADAIHDQEGEPGPASYAATQYAPRGRGGWTQESTKSGGIKATRPGSRPLYGKAAERALAGQSTDQPQAEPPPPEGGTPAAPEAPQKAPAKAPKPPPEPKVSAKEAKEQKRAEGRQRLAAAIANPGSVAPADLDVLGEHIGQLTRAEAAAQLKALGQAPGKKLKLEIVNSLIDHVRQAGLVKPQAPETPPPADAVSVSPPIGKETETAPEPAPPAAKPTPAPKAPKQAPAADHGALATQLNSKPAISGTDLRAMFGHLPEKEFTAGLEKLADAGKVNIYGDAGAHALRDAPVLPDGTVVGGIYPQDITAGDLDAAFGGGTPASPQPQSSTPQQPAPEPQKPPEPAPKEIPQPKAPVEPAGNQDWQNHPATTALQQSIQNSPGLSPQQQKQYTQAMNRVMSSMPTAAHDRIAQHIKSATFHPDTKGIGLAAVDDFLQTEGLPEEIKQQLGEQRQLIESGELSPGGAFTRSGQLHVDGDYAYSEPMPGKHTTGSGAQTHEVYAHELGHAIDGPNGELSESPEWQSAWGGEMKYGVDQKFTGKKPRLTEYGGTTPSEGLAEFARLLYGSDTPTAEIEADFPQASEYFKRQNLWPSR